MKPVVKKTLIAAGAGAALFVGALAAVPLFFSGTIRQAVVDELNGTMRAKLSLGDVSLSLLSNFPRATIAVSDVSIVNVEPFEGDTLFAADAVSISVNIMDLISGGTPTIRSLQLSRPLINARVLADSTANWDITVASADSAKEASSFSLKLDEIRITDGRVRFVDDRAGRELVLDNLNHDGSGSLAGPELQLETETTALVSFTQGGTAMMKMVKAAAEGDVHIHLDSMRYHFPDASLRLNDLAARFDGAVALSDDAITMDMRFSTPKATFRDFLSVMPAFALRQFDKLKADGSFTLAGEAKGAMTDLSMPAWWVRLQVGNGSFRYDGMPADVRSISMDLQVSHPGGADKGATGVWLKGAQAVIAGEPVKAAVLVKNATSENPYIDATLGGKLNLETIRTVMPLEEGTQLRGIVAADIAFAAWKSSVDRKDVKAVKAQGTFTVSNLVYSAKDLPEVVSVPALSLTLSPASARLNEARLQLGSSDISATGGLDNIVGWVLAGDVLRGSLVMTSNKLDLDPWMRQEAPARAEGEQQAFTSPAVPADLDLSMSASFGKLRFNGLDMSDVAGTLLVRNRTVELRGIRMKTLGGSATASGLYDTRRPDKPHTEMRLDVVGVDIASTARAFPSLASIVPVAQYIKGSFGATMDLRTDLDGTLKPDLSSLTSVGGFALNRVVIENFKPFSTASSLLKLDGLKNPSLESLTPQYEVRNGRFSVKPFSTTLSGYKATISGSNGLDGSLDYAIALDIPAKGLSGAASSAISSITKTNLGGVNITSIPVTLRIGGTVDNPTVTPEFGSATAALADAAKPLIDTVQNRVNQEKEKIEARLKETEQRLRDEAAQAEQRVRDSLQKIRAELEAKAKEAERKAKEEAERRAKEELKKRIPNPFKKD